MQGSPPAHRTPRPCLRTTGQNWHGTLYPQGAMTSWSNRLFGPDTRPCVQKRVIVTPAISEIKKILNVDQLLICSTPILKHLKLWHTFLPLRETPLKIEEAGAKIRNFLNFKIQLMKLLWLLEYFQQCSMISRRDSFIKASVVPNFQNLWTLPKLPQKIELKNY